jgi:hypothetical protein
MVDPAYPAARAVAITAEAHLARCLEAARRQGRPDLAPLPDAEAVQAIIDAAFWASLRREEGHAPKISIASLPPEQAGRPLVFQQWIPLIPAALTKLAPAVEPGLLVVKYRRGPGDGKYGNVAVLQGDSVRIVDGDGADPLDGSPLATLFPDLGAPASWGDRANVLVQLAVSMRAHGRGGSLLVVPDSSAAWRESILWPIRYAVGPSHSELDALVRVLVTEPVVGATPTIVRPTQIGGTRHLSAAQFVHDQRDALALVASQDGRFTVFAWAPEPQAVRAHQVETLLL